MTDSLNHTRPDSRASRASADQGAGNREQGEDKNPSDHPIHPTSSTSTPEPATVDRSIIPTFTVDRDRCSDCGHQHAGPELARICIGCPCDGPKHTIEAEDTTDSRPVVGVVARYDGRPLVDRVAQAIGDPGSFLPRGDDYRESVTRWSTRAVMTLVEPLLRELAATESDLGVAVREASVARAALIKARPVVATLAGLRIGTLSDPNAAVVLTVVDEALQHGGDQPEPPGDRVDGDGWVDTFRVGRSAGAPRASDEPARCEHGRTGAHYFSGTNEFGYGSTSIGCPGPAASGTPGGGS